MPHPYSGLVSRFRELVVEAGTYPLGGFEPCSRPDLPANAPRALLFSAHPDDECITGGLPLRLLREAGHRIVNVAVTQGSNKSRQSARLEELTAACEFLGFEAVTIDENGLEKINPASREADPGRWQAAVAIIRAIIEENTPDSLFLPFDGDWNSTHIGTNLLVFDALAEMDDSFSCTVVETEYWMPMGSPNLMIESSDTDVADLIAATSFHAGEVSRNPYHLGLPAWMQDNVRRGSELVGGQGGQAANFAFATLYRLRRWRDGKLVDVLEAGKEVACSDSLDDLVG